jgi:hypothetical protein
MSNTNKVAEIFMHAGTAFSKLGEMVMELQKDDTLSSSSGKWTEEEIQLLKESVHRFGQDIEKISQMVRTRTAKQIKEAIKRRNLCLVKHANETNDELNNTGNTQTNPPSSNNIVEIKDGLESSQIKETNMTSGGSDHEIDVVNDALLQNLPNNK